MRGYSPMVNLFFPNTKLRRPNVNKTIRTLEMSGEEKCPVKKKKKN